MGMYTDFCFDALLNEDTPQEVLDMLTFMASRDWDNKVQPKLPKHSLFLCDHWQMIGHCGSAYFSGPSYFNLFKDDICGCWIIQIRCNLKNYDSEIEKFVDWIKPYLAHAPGDFLGFSRYEEFEEPTLIYM